MFLFLKLLPVLVSLSFLSLLALFLIACFIFANFLNMTKLIVSPTLNSWPKLTIIFRMVFLLAIRARWVIFFVVSRFANFSYFSMLLPPSSAACLLFSFSSCHKCSFDVSSTFSSILKHLLYSVGCKVFICSVSEI